MIGPIEEDSCSPVIDLSNIHNHSKLGTVVEISNVSSDSLYQADGQIFPKDGAVRSSSCWSMVMQLVSDYTRDFI